MKTEKKLMYVTLLGFLLCDMYQLHDWLDI
jgi:hypothetical protein